MSAVRDEEQLHREGAADFVAIEIVGRTPWQLFWVRFKRDRVAFVALGFILLLVLVAIFAAPISSALGHPPDAQYPNKLDLFGTPTGPSSSFLFGVDQIGRDVFSRVLYGAQVSLEAAFMIIGFALAVALPLGLIAGYFGGRTDSLLMRVMDAMFAFPPLILALTVAALLGKSLLNESIAIAIVFVPGFVRLIRGQVLAVREETFIEASRSIGAGPWRMIGRHIFPNVASPLIVQVALALGYALLAAAC